MTTQQIIDWLLEGDVSIQYQVHRDLLSANREDLQQRIEKEGFGLGFLSKRNPKGHWGKAFYQPKWVSSHYTLMDLRNLCVSPSNVLIKESIDIILNTCKSKDGGVLPNSKKSDVCLNGMVLNYMSYFKAEDEKLHSIIDCLLSELMPDGGFNCRSNRGKPVHSSLHTTLSVLEGFTEYLKISEIKEVENLTEGKAIIAQLLKNLEVLLRKQREILTLASETDDEGTNALMSDYIREQEKLVWMLNAYLG